MRSREEKKKCKGQESTIGKIIYSFLLFLPLLAIGVTCSYAMFNKNAYKSYQGNLQYTEISNLNVDNYIYDENAYISSNALNEGAYGYNFKVSQIKNVTGELNYDYLFVVNYRGQTNTLIKIYDIMPSYINLTSISVPSFTADSESETNHLVFNTGLFLNSYQLSLTFNYIGTYKVQNAVSNSQTDFSNVNYSTNFESLTYNFINPIKYNYIFDNTLSNIFYYSIDEVQQSPLFNWAKNSIIYTTTATTCNALSITTPFIPLLMSYWLIISVIYFLYDIALMLVWIIHKKIHELQESI